MQLRRILILFTMKSHDLMLSPLMISMLSHPSLNSRMNNPTGKILAAPHFQWASLMPVNLHISASFTPGWKDVLKFLTMINSLTPIGGKVSNIWLINSIYRWCLWRRHLHITGVVIKTLTNKLPRNNSISAWLKFLRRKKIARETIPNLQEMLSKTRLISMEWGLDQSWWGSRWSQPMKTLIMRRIRIVTNRVMPKVIMRMRKMISLQSRGILRSCQTQVAAKSPSRIVAKTKVEDKKWS